LQAADQRREPNVSGSQSFNSRELLGEPDQQHAALARSVHERSNMLTLDAATDPEGLPRSNEEATWRSVDAARWRKSGTATTAVNEGTYASRECEPRPGGVIGANYRLIALIGRGSMGTVFLALDQRLDRKVAVKLIRRDLLQADVREQFIREARLMARVNHPNVVAIHTFGEHGSRPYFVMDLVSGTNLEQWMCAGPRAPDVRTGLRIVNDVCLGMAAVHASGAVHRDLKPRSILLDARLHCRVADFGVATGARDADREESVETLAGWAADRSRLSRRTTRACTALQEDIFALGCIAYEVLTGVHPSRCQGRAWTDAGGSGGSEVIPPSHVRATLPLALDQPILRALDLDWARRQASVEVFRVELMGAR
jgi:serine/threonine protein kinase